MLKLLSLVLCLFTFTASAQQSTKTNVVWGTDVWENFTQVDGTGFYHQLMQAVFEETEFSVEVEYLSWKRTLSQLERGRIDMSGALPKNERFWFSERPILSETIFAVSLRKDEQHCCDWSKGLGAFRSGYDDDIFYAALPSNAEGIPVDSADKGVKLVIDKKIDYYVDVGSVLKETLAKSPPQYLANYVIGQYNLHWAFTRSDRGKMLQAHFDRRIKELDDAGVLETLYLQYGLSKP